MDRTMNRFRHARGAPDGSVGRADPITGSGVPRVAREWHGSRVCRCRLVHRAGIERRRGDNHRPEVACAASGATVSCASGNENRQFG